MASPSLDARSRETRRRLDKCWTLDLSWNKYPEVLQQVYHQLARSFICKLGEFIDSNLLCFDSKPQSLAPVSDFRDLRKERSS